MMHVTFRSSAVLIALVFSIHTACAQSTDSAPKKVSDVIQSEKQAFRTEVIASGFDIPWSIAFLPDGSLLVTERPGKLRIIENGVLRQEPIKGTPEVWVRGQGGLLDVAVHPNFEENGWIYLSYSYQSGMRGHTAIMRAKLNKYELTQQQVIFKGEPLAMAGVHFAGKMVFAKDGTLHFSIGDRGSMENAQSIENHSGKTFRIHDDGRIPADNPFVGKANAKGEIWSYGNRNPQGLAFNPFTGELWAHEHGPKGGDEINIIGKGKNYGWPLITFGINYNDSIISADTAKPGLEQPIHYWNPSIAPSGMAFVNSDKYPGWKGNLMVGALAYASLYRCEITENDVTHVERLLAGEGRIRDVRLSPDGFIYIANETTGSILKLVPVE